MTYFLSIIDVLHYTFSSICILSAIGTFACGMFFITLYYESLKPNAESHDKKMVPVVRKLFYLFITIFILTLICNVAIPTQNSIIKAHLMVEFSEVVTKNNVDKFAQVLDAKTDKIIGILKEDTQVKDVVEKNKE